MLMTKKQILEYLPHRAPFLFVDSIEDIIVSANEKKDVYPMNELIGSRVIAHFYVNPDLDIFRGHFPGHPILPGVIQVEIMAQASSFIMMKTIKDPFNVKMEVALMGVDDCKFRRPVLPGMNLRIHSTLVRCRGPVSSYKCIIYSGEELVSEGSIMASARFL